MPDIRLLRILLRFFFERFSFPTALKLFLPIARMCHGELEM